MLDNPKKILKEPLTYIIPIMIIALFMLNTFAKPAVAPVIITAGIVMFFGALFFKPILEKTLKK